MKKLIFKIRFWLMPAEFKKGQWIVFNGNFYNTSDFWKKGKKYWSLHLNIKK